MLAVRMRPDRPMLGGPNQHAAWRGMRQPDTLARDWMRKTLYAGQDAECHYCERYMTFESCTFDHIVPSCLGGTWILWNLVLACRECNNEKGDDPEFCWCPRCEFARATHRMQFNKPQLLEIVLMGA